MVVTGEAALTFDDTAIPVFARGAQRGDIGGTGFLVRKAGQVGLITTLHHLTQQSANDYGTIGASEWADVLFATTPDARAWELQIWSPAVPRRLPTFSFKVTDVNTGLMADMMAVFDPRNAPTLDLLASNYRVLNLDAAIVPSEGEMLTVWGYPAARDPWPTSEGREGQFLRFNGRVMEAAIEIVTGFSGGPCLNADWNCVGMIMGSNGDEEDAARIVPANLLATL